MHILDIRNELEAHYGGCYGIITSKENALGKIVQIEPPEPDDTDEYGDPIYSEETYPHTLDIQDSIHLFEATLELVISGDIVNVMLNEVLFGFPESKLVQNSILVNNKHIPMVKRINRSSHRQYRRGLRLSGLSSSIPNSWMYNTLTSGAFPFMDNIHSIEKEDIDNFFKEEYPEYIETLEKLKGSAGTICISPDWWVGQGHTSLVVGWRDWTAGVVEGQAVLLNEDHLFLKDSLIETIGNEALCLN